MAQIFDSGNFAESANPPLRGTESAHNFQASKATNRTALPGSLQNVVTGFNYGSGWGGTLVGFFTNSGLWLYQGWASYAGTDDGIGLAIGGGFTCSDFAPQPVGTVSVLYNEGYGSQQLRTPPDGDTPSTTPLYLFNGGATATINFSDFIEPGIYSIVVSCTRSTSPQPSGNVQIYAGGQLITTLDASSGSGTGTFNFSSANFFKITCIQLMVQSDYSGYAWQSGLVLNTFGFPFQVIDSGSGVPGAGLYWGYGPNFTFQTLEPDFTASTQSAGDSFRYGVTGTKIG